MFSPLPRSLCEALSSTVLQVHTMFPPLTTGHYCAGGPRFVPATPLGILEILRRCNVPTLGRNVCVVDRDKKVGEFEVLILRPNMSVHVLHSKVNLHCTHFM